MFILCLLFSQCTLRKFVICKREEIQEMANSIKAKWMKLLGAWKRDDYQGGGGL